MQHWLCCLHANSIPTNEGLNPKSFSAPPAAPSPTSAVRPSCSCRESTLGDGQTEGQHKEAFFMLLELTNHHPATSSQADQQLQDRLAHSRLAYLARCSSTARCMKAQSSSCKVSCCGGQLPEASSVTRAHIHTGHRPGLAAQHKAPVARPRSICATSFAESGRAKR